MTSLARVEREATRERFVVLEGRTDTGAPFFMSCNRALKRIDHILHSTHTVIDLAILDQNPHGLTTAADAVHLDNLEDELDAALAGIAVYFARETQPGHRVVHFYAPDDSAAQTIIERWAAEHSERRPRVEWIRDPSWKFVQQYG